MAALVGASVLNLVDSVIREQERLPLDQRRGVLVVVDEMQTIPGVEFESMLSELGKYGASFVLATQSLRNLDELSPTMRDTLLAIVGCLAAFQVAGSDARKLLWEFSRERLSEDDVVSQPVHHSYVRATVGVERLPTLSMAVVKPELCDPEQALRIRGAASEYTTPLQTTEAQHPERIELLVRLRKQSGTLSAEKPETLPEKTNPTKRRKQRSKLTTRPVGPRRANRAVPSLKSVSGLVSTDPIPAMQDRDTYSL